MSSEEEDYEYDYSDGSGDEDGGPEEEDTMSMDTSSVSSDKPSSSNTTTNKKRPYGSMDGKRASGGEPRLSGDGCQIRMLPAEELKPVMQEQITEAVEVLGAPSSASHILLREHKWAKEGLFQSFFDNPEKVQEKCGVLSRCQGEPSGANADKKKPAAAVAAAATTTTTRRTRSTRGAAVAVEPLPSKKQCEICMDEDGFEDSEMIGMPCGHEFCETCWYGYIHNALEKGPACVRETCPEAGCNELITEEEVCKAAPDLLPKFESYQLRSFVETYGMTRWCPGPGCGQVALAPGSGGIFAESVGTAKCNACETCFCLKCGEEPHAPATCKELAVWQEKCRNESETANWILANTKPCPKCSNRIEKNQGCNHMTCRSCHHHFCWICMGDWSEHGANTGGYYKCNKFDANADGNDQSDAAKAKRELNRYLHYYKRYHEHSQAQDFAKKSVKDVEARMVLLQEQNSSNWTDVEFLKSANKQLVECRKVLKYSYTFAFYLEEGDKKTRFEYHQEMLERFTEHLSELSEKPIQEMNRTEVVNQTRVVDNFMKNILKYVDEGMED